MGHKAPGEECQGHFFIIYISSYLDCICIPDLKINFDLLIIIELFLEHVRRNN